MVQRKTEAIMVLLEPDLRTILQRAIDKHGMSASSYFRRLAIEDLKREGLLTDEILVKITVG